MAKTLPALPPSAPARRRAAEVIDHGGGERRRRVGPGHDRHGKTALAGRLGGNRSDADDHWPAVTHEMRQLALTPEGREGTHGRAAREGEPVPPANPPPGPPRSAQGAHVGMGGGPRTVGDPRVALRTTGT